MDTRSKEKFIVHKAKTERYKRSSIPFMQNLLNQDAKRVQKVLT